MSKLKEEYHKLIEQRKRIIEEMDALEKTNVLEESKIANRYLELKRQNEELYNQQLGIYKVIKEEEYSSCEHVLVYSRIDHDRCEERTYKSCGCIKCGLDESVLDSNGEFLSFYGKIMYNYLRKNNLRGVETKISCDLDLAQAIYSKIKVAHPNIDDKTAIKYFNSSLDNIRNIAVSDNRKVSRAQRLSLNPSFKRWNARDIHND